MRLKSKIKTNIIFSLLLILLLPIHSLKSISQTKETHIKTEETKIIKKEVMKPKIEIENESLAKDDKKTSDTILIQTDKGPIKIKLFRKETPITTDNFIDLVKKGFYNGTVYHRVVPNFVIQGGDPLGDGTGNYIDQEKGEPRFIKLERTPDLKFDRAGRVGMARTANPNSASCQFFIALQALPSLDPGGVDPYGYAIFGQVSDDTLETVKKIVNDSKPAYPGSDRPANPVKMQLVTLE